MPGFEKLLPFLVATLIFATLPGPGILYTAAQTMARGRRGGLLAVAGLQLGGLVHVIAAAAGLSTLLRFVPELYVGVKLAGALYLVWLGISIVRSSGKPLGGLPLVAERSQLRMLVDSVLVEVLNPKTALFFIAFLPQFAEPQAAWPTWAQMLVLGSFVNVCFSSMDVVTVFVTSAVLTTLKASHRAQRFIRRVGGTILAGLGIHLALSRS